MELPPELKHWQQEFEEQLRCAKLSMQLQHDYERVLVKQNDYDYMKNGCYNVKPCGCHCGFRCESCAREHIVNFFKSLPLPKVHGNQANPLQSYAFTLTMPPGYVPKKPLDEVAKMIMEHGITNKPYEKATEWAFVLEHTEQGTPHIHGMYKTNSGRRIASKYFQRYWPLWDEKTKLGNGHKGGYHNRARHDQSYIAYMAKEGVIMTNAVANGNF